MARRRVNKSLLLTLICGFIVLLGLSWGYWQGRMRRHDPSPYMRYGKELMDQREFLLAMKQYSRAKSLAGRMGDTQTQIEALVQMSKAVPHLDVEGAADSAIMYLRQAVTKDPQSIRANKARMEMQYEKYQKNPLYLRAWEDLQEYADDVINIIESDPSEKLDEDNARAHYLRGLAMIRIIAAQAGMSDQDMLEGTEGALEFFAKAWQYQPSSPEYCKAVAQRHLELARKITIMRLSLSKEDRQLAMDHWHQAQNAVKQFDEQNPDSGVALVRYSDLLLDHVRFWITVDQRDEAAEDPQIGSGLADQELVDTYLETWLNDSTRPELSELEDAVDRLMADYLVKAEERGTDVIEVQLALAHYWQQASRRDSAKVRSSLEKVVELETDIIAKLRLYWRIVQTHIRDKEYMQALKVCEDALDIPVDLKIIRTWELRQILAGLHQSASKILLELTRDVKGTDEKAMEEFNNLLNRAEEHINAAMEVARVRTEGWQILTARAQILRYRLPRTSENNRQAIQLYEQARDEIENMSSAVLKRNIIRYVNLLTALGSAYEREGQLGAAETAMSTGLKEIQRLYSKVEAATPLNPRFLLRLANLQLRNRHANLAEQTLNELDKQIAEHPPESKENQENLQLNALRMRLRQFELQGKKQQALDTAQYIEKHFPEQAQTAFEQRIRILQEDIEENKAEIEALLTQRIVDVPDNPRLVVRLATFYLEIDQRAKAVALVNKSLAERPEFEQSLSRLKIWVNEEDREKLQQLRKEQLLSETSDPLRRHMGLFGLQREDYSYYASEAAMYARQGKTELAEQARQRSAKSYEQALASLEQAYEIRPDAPAIHKVLLSYYLRSKEWDKAEKLVNKAEEENWDGVEGLYFRGQMHNAKGTSLIAQKQEAPAKKEFLEALKYLEEAVRRRRKFSQAWAEKARSENFLGQYDASLDSAEQAEQQNPSSRQVIRVLLNAVASHWGRSQAADIPEQAKRFAERTYELAERALKIDPNYSRASRLRMAYLDEYDPDMAMKERSDRLESDPNDSDNLRSLLQLYRRQKKTEEMRDMLMAIIAKQPGLLEPVLYLAGDYSRTKEYDKALNVLLSAREQWPDKVQVVVALTDTYRVNKQYDKARDVLLSARKQWPDQMNMAAMLAEAYRWNNEPVKARQCLEEFLKSAKEEQKASVYHTLGLLEARLGQQAKAVKAFQQAIAYLQQYQPENVKLICSLSNLMFSNGARQAAIDVLLPIAEQGNSYAIRMLSVLYRQNSQIEQSIKWARQGVDRFPKSTDHKMVLSMSLLVRNETDEAEEVLKELIEQVAKSNPLAADAYILLAKLYSRQENYELAIRTLKEAISSGVKQPDVRFNLASLYQFEGRIREAVRECELLLEQIPDNRTVRLMLVKMVQGQGEYSRAEGILKQGRELGKEEPIWPQRLSSLWLERRDKSLEQRNATALKYALEAKTKSNNAPSTLAVVMEILNSHGEYDMCVAFYKDEVPSPHRYEYARILVALARAEQGRWTRAKSLKSMSTEALDQLQRRTIKLYYQALAKAGDNTDIYEKVIMGLIAGQKLDELVKSTEGAQDTPRKIILPFLLRYRARQWMASNQTAEGVVDLNRAVSLMESLVSQPELSPTLKLMIQRRLGDIYTMLDSNEKAMEIYIQVVQAYPNDVVALNNIAFILADNLNKPAEALKYIERAMRHRSQDHNLMDTYGFVLLKNGQINQAIIELKKSMSIRPTAMASYHLGLALKEAKDHKGALKALRETEKILALASTDDQDKMAMAVKDLIKEVEEELEKE